MIYLPWPPSVNTYYAVVNGRKILSKKGRLYKAECKVAMLEQGVKRGLQGDICMTIYARPPDSRRRDLDNILKPILDALTEYGAWDDDSQVSDLRIQRFNKKKGGEISVLLQ